MEFQLLLVVSNESLSPGRDIEIIFLLCTLICTESVHLYQKYVHIYRKCTIAQKCTFVQKVYVRTKSVDLYKNVHYVPENVHFPEKCTFFPKSVHSS